MNKKIIIISLVGLIISSGLISFEGSNLTKAKTIDNSCSCNSYSDNNLLDHGYVELDGDRDISSNDNPTGLPSSWDWRNVGGDDYTTSVKNQGDCGSCWAFAAMGALESVIKIVRQDPNYNIDLSEQYLISCCPKANNYCPNNCNGGNAKFSINWMADNKGALIESCFPYEASNLQCSEKICETYVPIDSCTNANGNLLHMKKMLLKHGPLISVMAVYDPDFVYEYDGGVYRNSKYKDAPPNHQVLIVGYQDTERTILKPYDGYWICKNSWDTNWGIDGYFKIAYGECQIDSYTTQYTKFTDNDNLPIPELYVNTDSLNYIKRETSKRFTIKNNGDSDSKLFWFTNRYYGLDWIEKISPDSGVLDGGESVDVTVKIDYTRIDLTGSFDIHIFGGNPNGDYNIQIKATRSKSANFKLDLLSNIFSNHPLIFQIIKSLS